MERLADAEASPSRRYRVVCELMEKITPEADSCLSLRSVGLSRVKDALAEENVSAAKSVDEKETSGRREDCDHRHPVQNHAGSLDPDFDDPYVLERRRAERQKARRICARSDLNSPLASGSVIYSGDVVDLRPSLARQVSVSVVDDLENY